MPDAPRPLSDVDALFNGDPPLPKVDASATLRRLGLLLAVAIPLDGLGIFCWTTVPGAVLTLWAWLIADGQMALVEAEQFEEQDANRIINARRVAGVALVFCVFSMIVQLWLLSTNFYRVLWGPVLGI